MKPITLGRLRYRPTPWLWPGRIPIGALTLLAGRTEVGKSSLLSDVAARVSRGRRFPDVEDPTRAGRVLICSTEEDPESALLARAQEQDGDLHHMVVDATPFRLDEQYPRFGRLIRREEISLIIFDPLSSYLHHRGGQGLRDELQRLNAFVRQHAVACVGIVHLVKAAHKTVLAGMRGGGEFSEVARHILAVARSEPTDPRSPVLFGVVKSNLSAGNVPHLGFRVDTNTATGRPRLDWLSDTELPDTASLDELIAAAARKGKTTTTKLAQVESLLRALLADSGCPMRRVTAAVRDQTGACERTVNEAKARVGVVSEKRGSSWWWRLPSDAPPASAIEPVSDRKTPRSPRPRPSHLTLVSPRGTSPTPTNDESRPPT